MGGCIFVSFSCDQALNQVSQWLSVNWSYIHNVKENLVALEKAMEELKAKQYDSSKKVEMEENKGLRRLAEVQLWLTNVEAIENRFNELLSTKDVELQRLYLCGFCSKSLKLSYRYRKRVFMILKEVWNRKSNGVFEVVAGNSLVYVVVDRPIQPIIVGQETMLETLWNNLMEDEVGTIGLYVMGGVRKTTLLNQINNKFFEYENDFDIVILIVVSRDYYITKIQEDIAKKLGLDSKYWNQIDKDQMACDIYNVLKRKKFVLLLDDIWEKVNLAEIGVPFPKKKKKMDAN